MSGCSNTTDLTPNQTPPRVLADATTPRALTAADEGEWTQTGKLAGPRLLHTATRLTDGRVLVAGGYNRSVEVFGPDSGVWTATGNTLETHTAAAAALLSNGRVLLAGSGNSGAAAELYNPATGTWAATGALLSPRTYHTLTALPDGRILAVGGVDEKHANKVLATAELYNPTTGTWAATGALGTARRNQTATLLSQGKVLVTGGLDTGGALLSSAELFDPSTGTWSAVAGMSQARASHSATLLADGQVLVVGGEGRNERNSLPAEVFNPTTGSWKSVGRLSKPRRFHSATLLPNQRVLVAGGYHEFSGVLGPAELYDPATGTWRAAGTLAVGRYSHTATLLPGGRVLVAGGNNNTDQSSAELYTSFFKPEPGPPEGPITEPRGTSLLVHVVNASGTPVPGALVHLKDSDRPTDAQGDVLFESLPSGALQARVSAPGFTAKVLSAELEAGAHLELTATLRPTPAPIAFNASEEAHLSVGRTRVTLPAGSLVDDNGQPVTGMAEVIIDPIDPSTNDLASAPGPFVGISAATGERVDLDSGFMAEITPMQNGRPLQLAPGARASITLELPTQLTGENKAGDQVSAWWFDTEEGVWREDGQGTLVESPTEAGKLLWTAEVKHFSFWGFFWRWHWRHPYYYSSCIDVFVKDQYGNPLPNRAVNVSGITYGYSGTVYTQANGHVCVSTFTYGRAYIYLGYWWSPWRWYYANPVAVGYCGRYGCTSVTLTLPVSCGSAGTVQACAYTGPSGTNGVGTCKAGYRVCNGTDWGACTGQVTPSSEVCGNATDENCNGKLNDGCPPTCNKGQTEACYAGPAGTAGVGACKAGSRTCLDGYSWSECTGQVTPAKEVCANRADDDCDGAVDEGCGVCNPGDKATCYTGAAGTVGVGTCRSGTTTCYAGSAGAFYGACVGETTPAGESCDGKDNDCDGVIDEGNPGGGASCSTGTGTCSAGTTVCTGGALVCRAAPGTAEICDGKDNDCDGLVDEDNPGGGVACSTGKSGVCSAGTTTCTNGALFCAATTTPSVEVCDGRDNDCDGITDEDNPGGGAACATGRDGVCAAGTTTCSAGTLFCAATTSASAEICDGKDNDCDGAVDEDNPGEGVSCQTGQQGACSLGFTICARGSILCRAKASPTPEVCDNVDNNCDGVVDEGCQGGTFSFDFDVSNTSAATRNTEDRTVPLKEGQTLKFGTCNLAGAKVTDGDTILRLINPSGSEATYNDDACGKNSSYLEYTVRKGEEGRYTLKTGCYGNTRCAGTAVYSY